jgi:hypothetical protein
MGCLNGKVDHRQQVRETVEVLPFEADSCVKGFISGALSEARMIGAPLPTNSAGTKTVIVGAHHTTQEWGLSTAASLGL